MPNLDFYLAWESQVEIALVSSHGTILLQDLNHLDELQKQETFNNQTIFPGSNGFLLIGSKKEHSFHFISIEVIDLWYSASWIDWALVWRDYVKMPELGYNYFIILISKTEPQVELVLSSTQEGPVHLCILQCA